MANSDSDVTITGISGGGSPVYDDEDVLEEWEEAPTPRKNSKKTREKPRVAVKWSNKSIHALIQVRFLITYYELMLFSIEIFVAGNRTAAIDLGFCLHRSQKSH